MNLKDKLLQKRLAEGEYKDNGRYKTYKMFVDAFGEHPQFVFNNEVWLDDFKFVVDGSEFKVYVGNSYIGSCSNFDELYNIYFRIEEPIEPIEAIEAIEAERPLEENLNTICHWLYNIELNKVIGLPYLVIYSDGSGSVSVKKYGERDDIYSFDSVEELLKIIADYEFM